jgi:chemotaxis protein CheC
MRSLTVNQIDALKELINIGVGRAASLLNEMVDSRILLEVPFLKVLTALDLQRELAARLSDEQLAIVRLGFGGAFSGTAELLFPTESASTLVSVLTGEDIGSPDLDDLKIGTLSEIGNILINGVMGSIGNVLQKHINYAIPVYLEDTIDNLIPDGTSDATILLAQASFTIEQLQIIGDIILIFEVQTFDTLLNAID